MIFPLAKAVDQIYKWIMMKTIKSNEMKHGWESGQVVTFAKRFAGSDAARAWSFLVPEVRKALIRSFVMDIALGVDREGREPISVAEVQSLADDVIAMLAARHRMPPAEVTA